MLKMVDANNIEFVHEQCEALRKIFYPEMEEALNMGRKKTLKTGDAIASLGEDMPVSEGMTVADMTTETGRIDKAERQIQAMRENLPLSPEIRELIEMEVVRRVRAIAPDLQSLVARIEALEKTANSDSLSGTSLEI